MKEIQIGEKTNAASSVNMSLNLEGIYVSENRDEYWITLNNPFDFYLRVNKDTTEGRFISDCILSSKLLRLENYLEDVAMRFITAQDIKEEVVAAYDRGYDKGRQQQQIIIKEALGINE